MKGTLGKITKSSFKCSLYDLSANNHSYNNILLGHYLAGLVEGDGSIIVLKTIRNKIGKLLYPKVKITFVDKDTPLAKKIKEVLNSGTMVYHKN